MMKLIFSFLLLQLNVFADGNGQSGNGGGIKGLISCEKIIELETLNFKRDKMAKGNGASGN